jgi:hypothetical protein
MKDVGKQANSSVAPATEFLMFADIIGTDRGLSMYGFDGASGSFLLIAAISVALLFGSLLVFSLNH